MCHDGGDVLCCDNCARVFHVGCSGLSKAPEGEEDWFCPVCKVRKGVREGGSERGRECGRKGGREGGRDGWMDGNV